MVVDRKLSGSGHLCHCCGEKKADHEKNRKKNFLIIIIGLGNIINEILPFPLLLFDVQYFENYRTQSPVQLYGVVPHPILSACRIRCENLQSLEVSGHY